MPARYRSVGSRSRPFASTIIRLRARRRWLRLRSHQRHARSLRLRGGVIRYTLDGGTTLLNASCPGRVRDTLRSFHMGNDGVVLFSTNNGASWTELPKYRTPPQHPIAPNKAPKLWDVWFEDRLHGYVVGFENTVIETFDGGQTWQDLSPTGHASFANPQWYRLHVFAPGEFVTTADNGWVLRVNNGAKAANIINSSCYAPQIAIGSTDLQLYGLEFIGDEGIASGGIGNNDGYIYRSIDRGVTWALDSSCLDHLATAGAPGTTPPTFYGLDLFGDVSRGVTVGYGSSCYIGGSSNSATATTGCPTCPSGSQAWSQVLCDSDQNTVADPFDDIGAPLLRDISSSPSTQVGFAIGDFGTLRRTDDQGTTWTELSGLHLDYAPSIPINPDTNKEYTGSMNAAAIADDGGRAVVCGARGRIAVRDASGTWHDRSIGTFADGPELTSALTVGNGSAMMLGG